MEQDAPAAPAAEAAEAPKPAEPAAAPEAKDAEMAGEDSLSATVDSKWFQDPDFVQELLGSLPGVDITDPRIQAALQEVGADEKEKKDGEKKDDEKTDGASGSGGGGDAK